MQLGLSTRGRCLVCSLPTTLSYGHQLINKAYPINSNINIQRNLRVQCPRGDPSVSLHLPHPLHPRTSLLQQIQSKLVQPQQSMGRTAIRLGLYITIPPEPASTSTHLPAPVPTRVSIPINNTRAVGAAKKTKKAAASRNGNVEDVSDIHLDGDETDNVPVYDTCDEIRRKLTAYLHREGVTQAALLRMIHTELREGKKTSRLQSSQLTRFLQMRGANTGNTSVLFYASYVYFEKLRVKQGKPKSKHREEMERIWGEDGFDIETSSRGG